MRQAANLYEWPKFFLSMHHVVHRHVKENYNLEIVTPNIYDQTHIWTITINTQENIDLFYEIYIWDIENYLVKNTFELSKNQLCSSIFSKFKYSKYIIITANNCN